MARSRSARFVGVALTIGALSASLAFSQTTPTSSWPQFRGPHGAGIAPGSGSPPNEFGPSKNLAWRTALPAGHSSPVIWGDRIFLTAVDTAGKKLEVIALDKRTGTVVWRRATAVEAFEKIHPMGSPASATPAVDGERVYAYFGSYGLLAYDLNGKLVWELPMPVLQAPFGSGTSPVVAGELVILNRQEPKDPFIVAFDRKTGKMVWKHQYVPPPNLPYGFSTFSTPLITEREVIVHGMSRIEAFELLTGKPTWWVNVSSTGTSTPVVAGDTAFVSIWSVFGEADQMPPLPEFDVLLTNDKNGNGTLDRDEIPDTLMVFSRPDIPNVPGAAMSVKGSFARVDMNKDGEIQRQEWDAARTFIASMKIEHGLLAIKLGGAGDVTDSHVLWKHKTSIPEVPSPIVYRDRVYLVRNGGIVTCLDAATGTLVYRERVGAGGPYFASPVAVDGRLILGSGDGVVTVLKAGDRFDVLARNDFGENIFASPAIVDGVIYVRTPSALLAFSAK